MISIHKKFKYYVGVDTHKFIHTVCLINEDNDTLLTFTFKNEPAYYQEAISKLLKVTKTKDMIFGLEDTQSYGFLFAHYLTTIHFDVKHVDPALANAYRSSLPTFHKTDDYDAYCVAKVLRDNYKRFASFHHELVFTNIRLLVNQRSQIVKQQSSNYIMLHQQLDKVYPGYSKFFSTLQMRSSLAFFNHFPSPRHLKGYTKEELTKEMKTYTQVFPITKAEKILSIVRSNPIPFSNEIVEGIIKEIIQDIYSKEEKLKRLELQLESLIEETGYQLHTIPGVKTVTAAKLISEIGDIQRFKNANQLAKYAGIAPISVGSSGKTKEYASKGGNRNLRSTFYFLAVGMVATDRYKTAKNEMFREYFLDKVANGKTKKQALICVMRQLVRIIYAMMKSKQPYKAPNKKEIDS